MTEALDRIAARVAARAQTAAPPPPPAAPVNSPAPPPAAPMGGDGQRLDDIEAALADLADRVDTIEQAEIDNALAELDTVGDPGMMAALPKADAALVAAPSSTSLSQAARTKDAEQGVALPDGSFPIRNQADVTNALASIGRSSKDPATVQAHIKKRVNALGLGDWAKEHAPSLYAATAANPNHDERGRFGEGSGTTPNTQEDRLNNGTAMRDVANQVESASRDAGITGRGGTYTPGSEGEQASNAASSLTSAAAAHEAGDDSKAQSALSSAASAVGQLEADHPEQFNGLSTQISELRAAVG